MEKHVPNHQPDKATPNRGFTKNARLLPSS
jgi:hypothetical protein